MSRWARSRRSRLQNGTASGTGGCNQYSGPYTLDGDSLTFGDMTSTLRLCEGAGGMVETYYFADLPAVATWAIEGDALTLSADDGQPVVGRSPSRKCRARWAAGS